MDNTQIIYNYYRAKGLNTNQIAGIMGNIQQESNFDTSATNNSSGAYGLFQWLGSRKSDLLAFANSKGTSPDDIMTQLDFSWQEMNSTEKKTLTMLEENKYSSSRTIARLFEQTYERSGGSAVAKRQDYASSWSEYFGGVTGNTGGSTSTTGSVTSGELQDAINNTGGFLSSATSSEVELSLMGNILKATSVILVCALCIVFLILTLKNTAMKGITNIAGDIVKDAVKNVGKGGVKSE